MSQCFQHEQWPMKKKWLMEKIKKTCLTLFKQMMRSGDSLVYVALYRTSNGIVSFKFSPKRQFFRHSTRVGRTNGRADERTHPRKPHRKSWYILFVVSEALVVEFEGDVVGGGDGGGVSEGRIVLTG